MEEKGATWRVLAKGDSGAMGKEVKQKRVEMLVMSKSRCSRTKNGAAAQELEMEVSQGTRSLGRIGWAIHVDSEVTSESRRRGEKTMTQRLSPRGY